MALWMAALRLHFIANLRELWNSRSALLRLRRPFQLAGGELDAGRQFMDRQGSCRRGCGTRPHRPAEKPPTRGWLASGHGLPLTVSWLGAGVFVLDNDSTLLSVRFFARRADFLWHAGTRGKPRR